MQSRVSLIQGRSNTSIFMSIIKESQNMIEVLQEATHTDVKSNIHEIMY